MQEPHRPYWFCSQFSPLFEFFRVRSELSSLQEVGAAWQEFESHLETLEVALRGDQEALKVLDLTLQRGGTVSPDLATSVRDLAKVLSEKHESPTLITQVILSLNPHEMSLLGI